MADLLDIVKFNSLPGPITAIMAGGDEHWISLLCVETGLMHLDIQGQTDLAEFGGVIMLKDINGVEYDPDTFYTDYIEE